MVTRPEQKCLPIEVEMVSLHREHRPRQPKRPRQRRSLRSWVTAMARAARRRTI